MHTAYDPLGQLSVAYAEKLPRGGCQYCFSCLGAPTGWFKVANLEEAKTLIINTLILQGVIEL